MTDGCVLTEEQGLGPVTTNQFGERWFFNLNRHSFDKVSARALYDAKFSDRLFKADTLNIVIGSDSGLLLNYVNERPLPKGTRYLFIEPDLVLQGLSAAGLLSNLDERIVCIGLVDWQQSIQQFKIADYFYIDAVQSFNALCAEDDCIGEYGELSWHIAEVLSQLHWQYSVELGTEAFIMRQIDNVADNRLPARVLENAFLGQTAVLLAGGPSLDQALDWVKENRQRFVLFAVSRISRQLLDANIEPDFVFSVDPTELSFDISKEMLRFGDKTVFVCSHHTVPTLLNQWSGLSLYLGPRLPWQSDLNVINLSSAGPTVTNTALNVAYQFGFRRIILAGVDLCFTREGFTHAKGSDEQLAGPRFNLTSLQVETNGGFMAPTSCDFAQAIKTLGLQAKILRAAGCRLINVAEGAAKLEDIDFMPLQRIEADSCTTDVQEIIDKKLKQLPDNARYLEAVQQELKRARFQVQAIDRLAAEARQLNDAMYNSEGVIVSFREKKQLDLIEKKLKRSHRQYSQLVKRFGIRRLIKLAKPFTDEDWTAEEAKQLGDDYYAAYREGAQKMLGLLDAAQERLLARQQELSQTPDFAVLFNQGQKDRSYGRVRIWRKQWAMKAMSPEIVSQFADFEQRFVEILNDKNTGHFSRAKNHSNLATVRQRAGILFKHKKSEELQDLLSALAKHDQQDAAIPYRLLVQAYLAELRSDSAAALDFYQAIVDKGDLLLEEALTRIAAIGIDAGDAQTAHLALQCLAQLNPTYLPLFADIQRLSGDVLAAIDTYGVYIHQFPQDTPVQMKLAMLYCDCKIYDGAEMMLDCILQLKPGYAAALAMKQRLLAEKGVAL